MWFLDASRVVKSTLRTCAVGLTCLVLLLWIFSDFGRPASSRHTTIQLSEEVSMVEWDHQTASGGILHVTATAAQAAENNMTLREWVNQLLEWFPPIVPEGH